MLPDWAAEAEYLGKVCKHCGDKITVICQLSLLGENGSFFCNPESPDIGQMHEMNTN